MLVGHTKTILGGWYNAKTKYRHRIMLSGNTMVGFRLAEIAPTLATVLLSSLRISPLARLAQKNPLARLAQKNPHQLTNLSQIALRQREIKLQMLRRRTKTHWTR